MSFLNSGFPILAAFFAVWVGNLNPQPATPQATCPTPTIATVTVSGNPAATAAAQITNLPPPLFQRYKKTVSDKTTNVTVGQPVELTTKPTPDLTVG
jgi:hypothetical protein